MSSFVHAAAHSSSITHSLHCSLLALVKPCSLSPTSYTLCTHSSTTSNYANILHRSVFSRLRELETMMSCKCCTADVSHPTVHGACSTLLSSSCCCYSCPCVAVARRHVTNGQVVPYTYRLCAPFMSYLRPALLPCSCHLPAGLPSNVIREHQAQASGVGLRVSQHERLTSKPTMSVQHCALHSLSVLIPQQPDEATRRQHSTAQPQQHGGKSASLEVHTYTQRRVSSSLSTSTIAVGSCHWGRILHALSLLASTPPPPHHHHNSCSLHIPQHSTQHGTYGIDDAQPLLLADLHCHSSSIVGVFSCPFSFHYSHLATPRSFLFQPRRLVSPTML